MKIVLIGGSTSSMTVAARLRRLHADWEIIVYQKESYVSFGACGLPYYLGKHFDDYQRMLVRSIEDFAKANIQIKPSTKVTKIDPNKKTIYFETSDGQQNTDTYDQLFIGVGAEPVMPKIPGIEAPNVFPFTRLEDAFGLKKLLPKVKKVSIIGSGFIGLETVEALGNLGYEISLIEAQPRLMARVFDQEMTELIDEELSLKNIRVFNNDSLVEIVTDDQGQAIKLKLASGQEVETDAVIMAIGIRPATHFLKNTDLEMINNGALVVDRRGSTNLKDIWSCGDCATSLNRVTGKNDYLALATVARKFAKVVANNMSGLKTQYAGQLQTAIIKVFDLECARTGLSEAEAKAYGYDFKSLIIKDKDRTDYVKHQKPLTLKVIMDKKSQTLIGAQIVGYNSAILRIDALIPLIWSRTKVDNELEQLDLPYAPPFSRPVDIINIALSKLAASLEEG
ncbi:NADPH-dependent 2,4-dienoyl-CoA reductase/sulfur reductase-like enzyme [Entomoplasma freundtii]|uniref:NADH oxidase n=1 Tax=Entomoplasma freundtii TaxID=74700 RepID=A0A2K8NQL5_9MOLU|nr:CoA-disulfide reductase [Entomoplasma freundtii]ATZ16077.1 NADH oxidase [Entomoplasma freundtii]TDY57021.1 NADPH-dependent 2,4-dienoyl-CoA reductase/sulfur reductase-like enzyme [Entomoplasma freundtii]